VPDDRHRADVLVHEQIERVGSCRVDRPPEAAVEVREMPEATARVEGLRDVLLDAVGAGVEPESLLVAHELRAKVRSRKRREGCRHRPVDVGRE
jgi:hypothetical protein